MEGFAEIRNFPRIMLPDGSMAYGGDQHWFTGKFARLAGCASVSASNLAAFYGLTGAPDQIKDMGETEGKAVPLFTQAQYLKLQKHMFRYYMRPGFMGFPSIERYEENFLEYVSNNGGQAKSEICRGWKDPQEAFLFAHESIDRGQPLALLILTHSDLELDEETWHWMTITGYEKHGEGILISNYGKRQVLPGSSLFGTHPKNDVKMIRFYIR